MLARIPTELFCNLVTYLPREIYKLSEVSCKLKTICKDNKNFITNELNEEFLKEEILNYLSKRDYKRCRIRLSNGFVRKCINKEMIQQINVQLHDINNHRFSNEEMEINMLNNIMELLKLVEYIIDINVYQMHNHDYPIICYLIWRPLVNLANYEMWRAQFIQIAIQCINIMLKDVYIEAKIKSFFKHLKDKEDFKNMAQIEHIFENIQNQYLKSLITNDRNNSNYFEIIAFLHMLFWNLKNFSFPEFSNHSKWSILNEELERKVWSNLLNENNNNIHSIFDTLKSLHPYHIRRIYVELSDLFTNENVNLNVESRLKINDLMMHIIKSNIT